MGIMLCGVMLQTCLCFLNTLPFVQQEAAYEAVLNGGVALDDAGLDGLISGHHTLGHFVEAPGQGLAELQIGVHKLPAQAALVGGLGLGQGHDALVNHPVDLLGDALGHGTRIISQLLDSLGGIEFVVADEIVNGKAGHALRLVGQLLRQVAHAAKHLADRGGQDSLDGGESRVRGEDVEDFLHVDLIAAQDVAFARAAVPAGAQDGLGHVPVVGAVEGALDACGHLALGVLADDTRHVAEGVVHRAGDAAGQDQAAVDLALVDGVQHQLAGGRFGLIVQADDRVGVIVVDFLDGRAHGLLGDRAGGADEDQAHTVLAALVDDVLGAVHVHVPDLFRHQVADGDHGRAVDAVDFGVLGNVREQSFERRDIGHVALDDLRLFGQVLGSLFATEDEGAHGQVLADEITDDGAAQVAGRPGDDVKLVVVGSHYVFLLYELKYV